MPQPCAPPTARSIGSGPKTAWMRFVDFNLFLFYSRFGTFQYVLQGWIHKHQQHDEQRACITSCAGYMFWSKEGLPSFASTEQLPSNWFGGWDIKGYLPHLERCWGSNFQTTNPTHQQRLTVTKGNLNICLTLMCVSGFPLLPLNPKVP